MITTKKGRMFHIGKKVPKGFEELPGGIHLGKGIWILPMQKIEKDNKNDSKQRAKPRNIS